MVRRGGLLLASPRNQLNIQPTYIYQHNPAYAPQWRKCAASSEQFKSVFHVGGPLFVAGAVFVFFDFKFQQPASKRVDNAVGLACALPAFSQRLTIQFNSIVG